jgi:hypothetical protein
MSHGPLFSCFFTYSFWVTSVWFVLWLFGGCRCREPGSKVQHGGGVHLRNPGFDDTKDESDLLHGCFLVVVKGHDQTLAFGQFVDGLRQTVPQLPIQVAEERIVLGSAGYVDQLFFT